MFFSIATQCVPLPGAPSTQLAFGVDPANSSLCTLSVNGHTLTFKRNGELLSVVEDKQSPAAPLAEFKSVDDEPTRGAVVEPAKPIPPKPTSKTVTSKSFDEPLPDKATGL